MSSQETPPKQQGETRNRLGLQVLVLPRAAITQQSWHKTFLQCLGKGQGQGNHKGCSDIQEDQYTRTVTQGMPSVILNSAWSSPWSSHFSPSFGSRGAKEGWTTPPFLLGRRRKMKGRMRLGWLSVGCEGKVSIKAMRPFASPRLTARLSGADSWSAGWLPRLAHRSTIPLYAPASKPARPGHTNTGSSMVSLPLPPDLLLIMGISMISGLSRPQPAWRWMAAMQSGLGGTAERGTR